MKMMRIGLFFLFLFQSASFCACSNNQQNNPQKKSLYYEITSLYTNSDYFVEDDYVIKRYLGNKDNIYACSIVENSVPMHGSVYRIHIDDYVSEKYYGAQERIVIYQNGTLNNLEAAYANQIIDLDFIKTFDTFRESHSPEELKQIYEF